MAGIGYSNFKREECYAESDKYIVTWAFGHLFELDDMDNYLFGNSEEKHSWSLDNLPFCPTSFKYVLKSDKGVKKQFNCIKSLINRNDVDCIVHAGDADREGEIIIRKILDVAGNNKPVYRLWLPAQTPEDIRDALRSMKPDSQYDNLSREGYARTKVDWLYGINLSRIASVKSGSLIRVGRVIVPIVKAIYDRDMEIKNFKPVPYLAIISNEETNGEKIKLTCKEKFTPKDQDKAQAFADRLNAEQAVVTDIKTVEKSIFEGKLLSQSALQSRAGKLYKFSPDETLALAQKLYEAGYISYPRTSSEYLANSEKEKTNKIIHLLSDKGFTVVPKDKAKFIYDDSKVESHSAITPTFKFPEHGDLNEKELKIYNIIFNRFLAVFCSEPCLVNRTTMTISVGDMQFCLKGDVFIQRGWMKYEKVDYRDRVLPSLSIGDKVNIHFVPEYKETQPPAHYTVETLLKFLQHPFRKDKALINSNLTEGADEDETEAPLLIEDEIPDDTEDYKMILSGLEIGTEATRAGIIKNAIDSGYISLKNNIYTILPGGVYYIEALWKMGIIMDKVKTAELGKTLKEVYYGNKNEDAAIKEAMEDIKDFYDKACATEVEQHSKAICKCPLCGGDILEGKKGYYCSNYQTCSLKGLWKYSNFVYISHKDVIALLKGSVIVKPYTTKSGYKISKRLRYDIEQGKIIDVSDEPMTVGKPKAGKDAEVLSCPVCGEPIVERPTAFSCSNKDCGFVLWKVSRYFDNVLKISATSAKALLTGKHVRFKLKSKAGKEYEGYLKLKINGKYANFEADGFPEHKKKGNAK